MPRVGQLARPLATTGRVTSAPKEDTNVTIYIVVENQGGVCVGIRAFTDRTEAEAYQAKLDPNGGDDDSYLFLIDPKTLDAQHA